MTFAMPSRTRAQESRAAIERIYVIMRHLLIRGHYRPASGSGLALKQALITLSPEIYGSIGDPEKVELNGLAYVIERLPCGIAACRFVKLVAAEGYSQSGFETIVPAKRRRNCYRLDEETMLIEIARGRSEIYDLLTHLTFMYLEADKIKAHALDENHQPRREWLKLEEIVTGSSAQEPASVADETELKERAFSYVSTLVGRTFEETGQAYRRFAQGGSRHNGLFPIVYWLGRIAMAEEQQQQERQVTFSPTLRERIGHHIHGERWAHDIQAFLREAGLWERPLHLISANLHSIRNCLYAWAALQQKLGAEQTIEDLARELSLPENEHLNQEVRAFARERGMDELTDRAETNVQVQVFDTAQLEPAWLPPELRLSAPGGERDRPVLLVMDYAFGEQSFELVDELLKPYKGNGRAEPLNLKSISVMGKAGTLVGDKGDLMLPTAHVFEGSADNYPLQNDFTPEDFAGEGLPVHRGTFVTVLGTSLQNADILDYFKSSSWNAIGLEMEGAHLQKAIQAASQVRQSIDRNVTLRYAYYASDNPLVTGSTLASGSLGQIGVKPTYLIARKILERILGGAATDTGAATPSGDGAAATSDWAAPSLRSSS